MALTSSVYMISALIPIKIGPFHLSTHRLRAKFSKPITFSTRNSVPFFQAISNDRFAVAEDGSAEQFLRNDRVGDFLRFKRGVDGSSGELQTAVVSYRKKLPWSILRPFLQVDLVSTIHIADKEYFTTLQKGLDSYDCVLYEMVTSQENLEETTSSGAARILRGSRAKGFHIIGFIQKLMAKVLALEFQSDYLDYQSKNWYHADLDLETFESLQLEKEETFLSFAREMTDRAKKSMLERDVAENLDSLRSKLLWASRVLPMPLVGTFAIICLDGGSKASDFPEFEALSRLDFQAALKFFIARKLTSEFVQVSSNVEEGSVIIGERNKAAIVALKRAIDEGHNRIAILYGGGHMPDLGRRLREEFDLIPSQAGWMTAWSITEESINSSSSPIMKKMAEISGWPLNRYQTLALLIFSVFMALDLCLWETCFNTATTWISELKGSFD